MILKLKFLIPFFLLFWVFQTNAQQNNKTTENIIVSQQLTIQGDRNFRDLGGIIGENGKKIAQNKLFRSGRLARITDADIDTIQNIGIKRIIDLRTKMERQETPDKEIEGVNNLHIPLLEGDIGAYMRRIMSKELDAKEFMIEFYGTIDSLKIASWTRIFDLLENEEPTLWHCSSGKDRTGMTTTLILASLGVDEKTIIKEFMMSNYYLEEIHNTTLADFEKSNGREMKDLISPLMILEEIYITTFLNSIKKEYGSIDNFLKVLGVDFEKMKANYLE